jgi:hypothetical protein
MLVEAVRVLTESVRACRGRDSARRGRQSAYIRRGHNSAYRCRVRVLVPVVECVAVKMLLEVAKNLWRP